MKNLTPFLIVLVMAASCVEKIVEKPKDLIPREKMTQLLTDMAILNAAKSTNAALLERHFDSPTDFLLEQYGVDSVQFVKSDLFYASQPLVYEAIYKEIADRLDKEKSRLDEERKILNDSLAKKSRQLRKSDPE